MGVLLVFFVVAVQGATTSQLRVFVTNTNCEDFQDLRMILNGVDGTGTPLAKSGVCEWSSNEKGLSFSTTRASISLRLGNGRSGCHRPGVDESNEAQPVAVIDLAWSPEKSASVVVETIDPPMPVSYLRIVDALGDAPSGARSSSIACTEYGWFRRGIGTVERVVEDEHVVLQLNVAKPDTRAFGLHADRLPARLLTRDGVLYELVDQRAKGINGSAASLSPNAIEVDALKLQQIGLKKLKVTVK